MEVKDSDNEPYQPVDGDQPEHSASQYDDGADDNEEPKPHPRRWLILAVFSLVAQGNGMVFLALASISGKAQTFYDVPASKVNLATILFYAIYVPFTPLATYVVNTTDGLRKSVLVAAYSMAIGTGLRCAAFEGNPSSFNYLLAGTSVAAINGPFLMACFTLVPARWFPDSERGLATSVGVLANQMGMVVGYLIPPLIVSETEDNGTLETQMTICNLTLFGISMAAAILAFSLFKSKPDGQLDEAMPISSREDMSIQTAAKICLVNVDFWIYGVGFALMAPIYWDMGSLLYQNLHPSGYSDAEIQIPGVVLQVVAIPGMIAAGKLIDATHRFEAIIVFSLTLAFASIGIFTWALTLGHSPANLAVITLAAASTGLAFSMVQPAMLDIVAERTHPVPHGYTCSVLYLGTMILGAVYIVIGDEIEVDALVLVREKGCRLGPKWNSFGFGCVV